MDVLLVRFSALGDVVHSLGAVRALALARPDLHLHFATQRSIAPVLENLPFLASVIAHDRRPAVRGFVRMMRNMRSLKFDVALDLQGNWKSAAACYGSTAPRRIGSSRHQRREPASAFLLNETVVAAVEHPAHQALAVVRALAPEAEASPSRVEPTESEMDREVRELRALGIDPDLPFRIMVASSQADNRSWPGVAMARESAGDGPPALWLSGPGDGPVVAPAGVPHIRHESGQLRRLVGLGGVAARAGAVVMGPDRGATHVLHACGVSCRVLFGPQDPSRTAPLGATVFVGADRPECVPCRSRRCTHPEGPVCMDFDSSTAEQLVV